jgi:D-sedoheptulose 7-phosphate isomerase
MPQIEDWLQDLLTRSPILESCHAELAAAAAAMIACAQAGRIMFFAGNGGSHADAEHIVGEFIKSFNRRRPVPGADREELVRLFGADGTYLADYLEAGVPALCLGSHPAFVSAMANDVSWEVVYAQQLYAMANPGDLFVAISTSGNSVNLLHAARIARLRQVHCVGLTGDSGGELLEFCDICIRVPASETPRIQELHQQVYHWLCATVERSLFGENLRGPKD